MGAKQGVSTAAGRPIRALRGLAVAAGGVLLVLEHRRQARLLRSRIDELRASRGRLAAAADAERQRLERDLHDGAQQRLVAVRVRLGLARELVAPDSELASSFDELEQGLDRAFRDLRELAAEIYPSLLATEGLPRALEAVARRSELPVAVEGSVGRQRAETESAVYYACLEALQNAAKHAGAGSHVRVEVGAENGNVVFAVTDDGRGFDPAVTHGPGLANMRDRVGALGGRLVIDAGPGRGVTVRGRVPATRPTR